MGPKTSRFGLGSFDLLEKIDKLFECNIGQYVDLPQLVVVGHQSSGKSSVLEALTKLPFPRDSSLCTRFATQITFRRSEKTHTTACVIAAQDADTHHKENIQAWNLASHGSIDADSFIRIVEEVIRFPGEFNAVLICLGQRLNGS